ncbi:hypothetical protein EON66_05770 [archaeon]|nr:MAG: hypothetical protein EON66_05770 [archaeon]
MMAKGRDVSEFYPDVVRNVIVKAVEVKKLVYTYLVHHAVRFTLLVPHIRRVRLLLATRTRTRMRTRPCLPCS